jgi:hypothetical protein
MLVVCFKDLLCGDAVKADDFDECVGTDCVVWFIPLVFSESECVLQQICALYFNCNDIWGKVLQAMAASG